MEKEQEETDEDRGKDARVEALVGKTGGERESAMPRQFLATEQGTNGGSGGREIARRRTTEAWATT
jgi:hypothetical protein